MSSIKKNIIANYLGRTWSAILGIILIPVYIKFLGVESYGLVGFYATLSSVLGILDLGIGSTINRELARRSFNNNDTTQRDLVRSLEIIYWIIAIISGIILFFCASYLTQNWIKATSLSKSTVATTIKLMGIGIAIQFPASLYSGALMGLGRQVLLNNILLITGSIKGFGAILILWIISPTIESFFIWQGIISISTTAILCLYVWKSLPKSLFPAKFSKSIIKEIWKYAAAISINSLIGVFLSQLDKIVLSKLLPLSDFAYYSIASTIGSIIWLIQIPINNAIFPHFVQFNENNEKIKSINLFHKSSQVLFFILIPVASILIFFSGPILFIWLKNDEIVEHSHLLVSLIVFGLLLNALASIPSSCANAFGWPQLITYTNTIQAIIIAPLMFIFIHFFKLNGAAIVYIIMNCTYVFFLAPRLINRHLKGQLINWILFDICIPMLISFSLCIFSMAIMPNFKSVYHNIIWILSTGIITMICTGLSLTIVRNSFISFLKKYYTKAST